MAASTPQVLRQGLYLGWAFSLCLVLLAILSAREDRQAVQTVGKDTAPSVIAAEHIKSALSAMDASAANQLLAAPGHAAQEAKAFDERRKEATKALIAAAENITYGDAERRPIENIELGIGEYEMKVQTALDYHETNDSRQDAAYLAAASIMDNRLWPAADELDKAKLDVMENTYETRRSVARLSLGVLIVIGAILIGVLLAMQVFLFRRTNRVLNLPLVACTLLAFAFVVHAGKTFTASMHHLKVAREDAFTSIHALWKARAAAYRAEADESRFLLLRSGGAPFEEDFLDQIDRLAKLPQGESYEQAANRTIAGKHVSGFTGFLADELNNVTFAGEGDAAKSALIALRYYVGRDNDIRKLAHAGKQKEAVAMALESRSGQSNWWFGQFDRELRTTLEINQTAFNAAVQNSFQTLSGFEWTALGTGACLCILLWVGMWQRLREYQA